MWSTYADRLAAARAGLPCAGGPIALGEELPQRAHEEERDRDGVQPTSVLERIAWDAKTEERANQHVVARAPCGQSDAKARRHRQHVSDKLECKRYQVVDGLGRRREATPVAGVDGDDPSDPAAIRRDRERSDHREPNHRA